MTAPKLIQVAMGEARAGRGGEVLSALLGSCVAIGLLWPQGRSCALAHCLLPDGPDARWSLGARYVNQALPSLFTLMGLRQRDLAQVQVILAGGASMLGAAQVRGSVGPNNIAAARRCLAEHGLTPAHLAVGGRRGRTLRIDCSTQLFSIAMVDRPIEELDHARI